MIRVLPSRAALTVAYMGGIVFLSSLPAETVSKLGLSSFLVNLGHVPLFAGLASVTLWSLVGPRLRCALLAAAICAVFALTDEWHQKFVPGRVPSVDDLASDGAGILIGIGAAAMLPGSRRAGATSRKGDADP